MKAIKIPHHKDPEIAISYAFFAILLLLPLFGGRWISNAGLYLMLYSIMGYSWNIFSGLTNIVSFGHAVYFGLGAYATFITVRDLGLVFPFSAILSTALASAMCGAIAYIVSYPFLGLRGLSFAICTLAFAEFMAILFTNTQLVERGREVAFIPAQTDLLTNYYMLFVLLFLIWTVFWKSRNSKLGLALIAIGENEDAASSLGIDVFSFIRKAYVISAICMGIAGACLPYIVLSATVETLFGVERSLMPLVICIIGGRGSILGPLLGAIIMHFLAEYLRATFTYLHWVFLGAIVIAVHIFEPLGIVGYLRRMFGGTR